MKYKNIREEELKNKGIANSPEVFRDEVIGMNIFNSVFVEALVSSKTEAADPPHEITLNVRSHFAADMELSAFSFPDADLVAA